MKKYAIYIISGVVVVGLLWAAFHPRAVLVEMGTVRKGVLEVTLDNDGITRVRDLYRVRAPLAGVLRRVELEEGDRVGAGETVVAVLEPLPPSLLDDRAFLEAESRVQSAQAALNESLERRKRAEGQAKLARSEYSRLSELHRSEIMSKGEVERAEREMRLWADEAKAAEAGVHRARFDVEVARSALMRVRPRNGDEGEGAGSHEELIVLSSPIDGQVFRVHRESGGVVVAGETILDLGDPAELEIVADYLSTSAIRMKPGDLVHIDGWGGDEVLPGRVRRIEPSGFTKVSALGVEEQRVNVIVDFDKSSRNRPPFGDGYRVETRVVVWKAEDVDLIPQSALFREGERWATFMVDGKKATKKFLQIGESNGFDTELKEGLALGDQVVLYPSDAVEEGVKVAAR